MEGVKIAMPSGDAAAELASTLGYAGAKPEVTFASRIVGIIPWAMIAGLLYAGLFIHPKPTGSPVVPPTIERRDLLLGVTVVDGNTIWLAGNFGKLLKSQDGGSSWQPQISGVDTHLQDVDAWDANHAVAVGNGATILRTDNGGATWEKIEVPHSDVANKLIRVRTGKAGSAWAVGEFGAFLHSTDFGKTWTVAREPEDVIINDIDASNPGNIWAVGEFGRMYHSQDGGSAWTVVQSASQSSLTAIEFRDANHAVAVGLDGAFLSTDNAGESWHKVAPDITGSAQHLFGVRWDAPHDRWLAVGAKGVWVTADSAMTKFAAGRLSTTDLSAHTKVGLVADGSAVIAGNSPGIWNNGRWESLTGR